MTLTEIDRKVLQWLAKVWGPGTYATPAEIGRAMGGTVRGSAQGLGRMGGRKAKRLREMGMVEDVSWQRGGFPAYRITSLGRQEVGAISRTEFEAGEQTVSSCW
jgi:predicted transcriptional regulator with HTH domain